jgi:UDP-2,3-diacylglucosamine hydrolase
MPASGNIYFASDFHLGSPDPVRSREREDTIVRWLDSIKGSASEIFLMGDIFDFWFEYKHAIPRGFTRFNGKLAELADAGIKITFFKGNHDMWMFGYFEQELGVSIVSDDLVLERGGRKFYLHHGDGLGPGDRKYKFLKRIFRSGLCQWLFARLHPNVGIGIAKAWSRGSRLSRSKQERFLGEQQEWLIVYSKEVLQKNHFDYFVFGHRHLPLDIPLEGVNGKKSRYVNLGEWINFRSYAIFDGNELELCYFEDTGRSVEKSVEALL